MSRVEISLAVLTITCMAWARIHYWRAESQAANTNSSSATATETGPARAMMEGEA